MSKGPVLSTTYNLIKGEGTRQKQSAWYAYFSEREGNTFHVVRTPDVSYLSERERKLLGQVFTKIKDISPSHLIRWLHEILPEWEDPGASSKPIDPRKILRYTMLTKDEIDEIEGEVDHLRYVDRVLNVVTAT